MKKGSLTSDPDVMEKIEGSCVIIRADSEAQALDILRQDPFYTSGEVVRHIVF